MTQIQKEKYKESQKKYWKKPINIVTPSDWMRENVKKSYLMKGWPVYRISNAIDIKKWRAIDKDSSRKTLKLPKELSLILDKYIKKESALY